jgi:hypothetical protein
MFDEKGSERNKKPRQRYKMSNQENVDLQNNMAAHSTGMVVLLSVILTASCGCLGLMLNLLLLNC